TVHRCPIACCTKGKGTAFSRADKRAFWPRLSRWVVTTGTVQSGREKSRFLDCAQNDRNYFTFPYANMPGHSPESFAPNPAAYRGLVRLPAFPTELLLPRLETNNPLRRQSAGRFGPWRKILQWELATRTLPLARARLAGGSRPSGGE